MLNWQTGTLSLQEGGLGSEVLQNAVDAISVDVMVMTQACDLEQGKVENVILWTHVSLNEHQSAWSNEMEAAGQNPTQKAWMAIAMTSVKDLFSTSQCKTGVR